MVIGRTDQSLHIKWKMPFAVQLIPSPFSIPPMRYGEMSHKVCNKSWLLVTERLAPPSNWTRNVWLQRTVCVSGVVKQELSCLARRWRMVDDDIVLSSSFEVGNMGESHKELEKSGDGGV